MSKDPSWSGRALVRRLHQFMQENEDLFQDLKVTPITGERVSITFIRCRAFEKFLDLLEEKMFVVK